MRIYYVSHTYSAQIANDKAQMRISSGHNPLTPALDGQYYENYITTAPAPTSLTTDPRTDAYIRRFDCGLSFTPCGKVISERKSSTLFLKYVIEGSLCVNGIRIKAGEMIFLEPYTPNSWLLEADSRYCWCAWSGEIVCHVAAALRALTPGKPYFLGTSDLIEPMFTTAIYNRHYEAINAERFIAAFTDQLLSILPAHEHLRDQHEPSPLVKDALARIDRDYASLNVEALAAGLFVDATYLGRAFRRELGTTPKAAITRARMTNAEYYLTATDKPIQRIAELVGYANYTNFYTAFRTQYGLSPEAYRQAYGEQAEH